MYEELAEPLDAQRVAELDEEARLGCSEQESTGHGLDPAVRAKGPLREECQIYGIRFRGLLRGPIPAHVHVPVESDPLLLFQVLFNKLWSQT